MFIKIFGAEVNYRIERRIFEELELNIKEAEKEPDEPRRQIIEAVGFFDNHLAIVMKPSGVLLKKEKLTVKRVQMMFECVRQLHSYGLIHRDLSPAHFYLIKEFNGDEFVFVIDIGCGIFIDEKQRKRVFDDPKLPKIDTNQYAGSVQYAANDILEFTE